MVLNNILRHVSNLMGTLMRCRGWYWATSRQMSLSENRAYCLQLTNSASLPPEASSAIPVKTSTNCKRDFAYTSERQAIHKISVFFIKIFVLKLKLCKKCIDRLTTYFFTKWCSNCCSLVTRRSSAFLRIDKRSWVTREPTTSSRLSVGRR